MKKKSIIILGSVVALCGLSLVASHYLSWPVDSDDASGDIAKSARFSRKQSSDKITNMEELLQNDSAYKDGIVAAYVVMQTRAIQFGSLVDMSNEVAGKIPEFAEVLKDMNETREMVNNVNASLSEAGKNLNAVLGGEECPDLTQNTINASLAYTTLQKQNKLANRFIETTDKYLETAEGDDRLKFVRDQWVDYQTMTANLEGDKESAEALAKKGSLLPAQKSLAAMETFTVADQVAVLQSSNMANNLNITTSLRSAIPAEMMNSIFEGIARATATAVAQNAAGKMGNQQMVEKFCNAANIEVTNNIVKMDNQANMVSQATKMNQVTKMNNQAKMLSLTKDAGSLVMATVTMHNAANVMSSYDKIVKNMEVSAMNQTQQVRISSQLVDIINSTATGMRAHVDVMENR